MTYFIVERLVLYQSRDSFGPSAIALWLLLAPSRIIFNLLTTYMVYRSINNKIITSPPYTPTPTPAASDTSRKIRP